MRQLLGMKFNFNSRSYLTKFSNFNRKRNVLLGVLYLATIAINLGFRANVPLNAAFASPHDDQLGVELASNILNGEWLGTWNNRTLAKPPGYSLYLVVAHFIPFDMAILTQILYISGSAIFLIVIQRFLLGRRRFKDIALYLIFVFLIFQPILFNPIANRIYRSSVSSMVLTLIFSILLLKVFEKISNFSNFVNIPLNNRIKFYLLVSALSLTYAFMVLYRHESFWILICSAPPFVLMLFFKFRSINRNKASKVAFLKFFAPVPVLLVLVYSLPIFAVQESNRSSYGIPLTENYFQGSFPKAINLWASVDVGRDPRPYVVVSATQRSAVYEISSTALLLKPFLEQMDSGWYGVSCQKLKLCDNSGPWFTWQIRDAAVQTGYVYSEKTFQDFFKKIATDIQNACNRSYFDCAEASKLVGSRPLKDIPKQQVIEVSIENFNVLLPLSFQNQLLFSKTDSFGAPEEVVDLFHRVVNYKNSLSYDDADLKFKSEVFEKVGDLYVVLNWVVFVLALVGIGLYWRRGMSLHLKATLIFLALGVTSQIVGTGIARISFEVPPSELYLLSAYPMLYLIDILGVISFINYIKCKQEFSEKMPVE
jgi:hypothetical protein